MDIKNIFEVNIISRINYLRILLKNIGSLIEIETEYLSDIWYDLRSGIQKSKNIWLKRKRRKQG